VQGRPAPTGMAKAPRFVVDAMLGSLARKLRIFGFDTSYFREGDDSALEAVARREGRTIVTADRSLFEHSRAKGVSAVLVKGASDRVRLASIAGQLSLGRPAVRRARPSRCAACNGELREMGKEEASLAGVPPKVLARHRLFFQCTSCSRLYWRGRHWEKLRRLSASLETKALT
jgi:uncharacterized protein